MGSRDEGTGARAASPEVSAELRQSYTRASYRVDAAEGAILLRVGRASPELDRWLTAQGASRYAFLSAANPGSAELSAPENARRHRRLRGRLRDSGWTAVPGESFDGTSGGWREKSLLVVGIDFESAAALAREFGQLALLFGAVGGPVELRFTGGGSATAERA